MLGSSPQGRSSAALYLWWALNIGIVLFVFLAFVFSTVTYTTHLNLGDTVQNHFELTQGGLIEKTYTVAPNFEVKRGSVTSFCDRDNNAVCEGLGPRWHNAFPAPAVASPAELGVFAGMGPSTTLYFFVLMADHTTLHVSYLDTSNANPPSAKNSASYKAPNEIWDIHARNTSTPNVAVVLYVANNETYLQTVTTTNTGGVAFNTPLPVIGIHDPNHNGTALRNLVVAGDWIIVTYGYNNNGASYKIYVIDTSQGSWLRPLANKAGNFAPQIVDVIQSSYVGNGYLVQANANNVFLGKITFNNNAPQIDSVGSAEYFVHFNSLQIHHIGAQSATGGSLVFVGTQFAFVDDPITISMFIEWKTTAPVLTVRPPTNLLGNEGRQPWFGQISMCYQDPTEWEPYGGLFFSFIDSFDRRAKIVRARPTWTDWNLHLLPSPALHISAHQYGRFRSMLVPTLHCNIATSPSHVLIAMQDFLPVFNTFTWHGGYRYAGVSSYDQTAGKSVNVIRAGIASGYEKLTPGYTYYIWNNGTVAPFTSIFELFTPNGNPFPFGTAISEGHIHIREEVLDYF